MSVKNRNFRKITEALINIRKLIGKYKIRLHRLQEPPETPRKQTMSLLKSQKVTEPVGRRLLHHQSILVNLQRSVANGKTSLRNDLAKNGQRIPHEFITREVRHGYNKIRNQQKNARISLGDDHNSPCPIFR